jgi:hypothetical protein
MRLRAPQTRRSSLAEAIANVIAGYLLALLIQRIAYPLFGISTTLATDSAIAAVFTATSLVRSYVLRRLFERFAALQSLGTRDART